MSSASACIISAALSGVAADREQCAAIPYTPAEYAREACAAREAGASVVHLHARRPDGTPSYATQDYAAIAAAISEQAPDLVLNFSTGAVGVPLEERADPVRSLRPDIAALNMGSMNYAKYSRTRRTFVFDMCFENTFSTIGFFLDAMHAAGSMPECECFDTGHVAALDVLQHSGQLARPFSVSLVVGVLGGAPADRAVLTTMSQLVPEDVPWQVVAVSRSQWEMLDVALALGGHVRVGLEDNFYLPDGSMASSNGDLVNEAARRVRASGRRVAAPDEARELLGLGV